MIKILLFTSIIISSALAEETCPIPSGPDLGGFGPLAETKIFAASDEEIDKAFCTRKTPFTDQQMNEWMEKNQSSPKLSRTINGIHFEDESYENLESFKYLTAYQQPTGFLDLEKHGTFTSKCKKVDCALKEIFGKDVNGQDTSTQILFMHRRYGFNASPLTQTPNLLSPWKKKELDEALLALSDYPEGVLPLAKSKPFIIAPRAKGAGDVIANGHVMLFKPWDNLTPQQRRSTIFHEVGHNLSGDIHEHDSWKSCSGWKEIKTIKDGKTTTKFEPQRPETIVSEYGKENPNEDLAESIVAYRYSPKTLQEKSPKKYEMLKATVFDGVEYSSENACKKPTPFSRAAGDALSKEIDNWSPTEKELREIANRCSPVATDMLAQNYRVDFNDSYLSACYQNSLGEHMRSLLKERTKGQNFAEFLEPMLRNAKVKISKSKELEIMGLVKKDHSKAFKSLLSTAFQDKNPCADLRLSYIDYDLESLQVSPGETAKEEFRKISTRICAEGSKSKKRALIASMIVD